MNASARPASHDPKDAAEPPHDCPLCPRLAAAGVLCFHSSSINLLCEGETMSDRDNSPLIDPLQPASVRDART